MAEHDKSDWIRIGLLAGYIGILITLMIMGVINGLYLLFFVTVGIWIVPFFFLMVVGEYHPTNRLPLFLALIGTAVLMGLFLGYGGFFYTEDLLLGILTTALYAIIITYIILRFTDTDDRQKSLLPLILILALLGGFILVLSGIIKPFITVPLVYIILDVIGGIIIAISLVVAMVWIYIKEDIAHPKE